MANPRVYENEPTRQPETNHAKILQSEEYFLFKKYIRPYNQEDTPMETSVERAEPQDEISARDLNQMFRRKK